MGEAVSAILPEAFGAAISPLPIIAVILMLFSHNARRNAPAFVLGWVLGLLVVAGIAFLVSENEGVGTDDDASTGAFILKAVLGVLLLLLAIRQWRTRPKQGEPAPELPAWMRAIDQISPAKAFLMGVLLAGPNPKNLILSIAAATSIAQLGASGADAWVAILAYVLLGSGTVGGPVAYYFIAGNRAETTLNEFKGWLGENSATVMAVLFVIFGFSLLSDGLQGLFA